MPRYSWFTLLYSRNYILCKELYFNKIFEKFKNDLEKGWKKIDERTMMDFSV